MKFILSIASAIFILISCSTSPNNNGGSTTTVVPVAPSNLTGTVLSSSSVSLSWVDNSTNETGFKIERRVNGTTQFSVVGTVNADVTGFTDVNLIANTSYEYRIYSFNAVGNSLTYTNTIILITLSQTVINIPTIITTPLSSITTNTALSGGNITSDGGATITIRGVIWSTNPSPTIALNTKTSDGVGVGNFVSTINGLTPNTIYYVRAYATNSAGTAYGSDLTLTTTNISQPYSYTPGPNITDVSGNVYPSIVTSCGQTWTSKNLNVSKYRNGDVIPQVTYWAQWRNLTTGAWCWSNNDSASSWQYGKIYNWYAVNDPRGIAPQGWHVPSDAEWSKLIKCIDTNADTIITSGPQSTVADGAMREMGLSHWLSPNTGATNSSGFTGLPSGIRDYNGTDYGFGIAGDWWSSSESNYTFAWYRELTQDLVSRAYLQKTSGFSVRLVKD